MIERESINALLYLLGCWHVQLCLRVPGNGTRPGLVELAVR